MTTSAWWADWPKFLPGWLAFAATAYGLIRMWLTRRHRLALGGDPEDLRAQLVAARRMFMEMRTKGRKADWFAKHEHQDLGQSLQDHADRRTDKELTSAVNDVAEAWNTARSLAPPSRARVYAAGVPSPEHYKIQDREDRQHMTEQAEAAEQGAVRAEAALRRLNILERRTTGR
ncbi:hypothetical protein ACWHBW_15760 [Streptomyces albidoflavus]